MGGAHLGAQTQSGRWVFGIEGTYDAMDFTESNSLVSASVDNLFTVTGRIGFAMDQWLAYVKGGYATAQIGVSEFVTPSSSDEYHSGWVVGSGLDYKIHKNLALGLEYNYIDLGSETHSIIGGYDLDPGSIHAFSARLTFLLNPNR